MDGGAGKINQETISTPKVRATGTNEKPKMACRRDLDSGIKKDPAV